MKPEENICMTTAEVAEYLQVSERTLKAMRANGGGIPFLRFGRIVRYRLSDVIAWRDSKMEKSPDFSR